MMPLMMLVPMMSHDQRIHVALHFYCLDFRNAVVPLMMLLASHETNASASGVT